MKKEQFLREKVKPEECADAMAEALIEELTAVIPGRGAHPNATGNMLKAVTKRSKVNVSGDIYWVGVGDLELLGRPGEKRYKPKPIERFLKQYNKEAEEAYQARREREAEYRRGVAERRAAREAEKAKLEQLGWTSVKTLAQRERELQLWYNAEARRYKKEIGLANMKRRLSTLEDRIDYWSSSLRDLRVRQTRTGHRVWIDRAARMQERITNLHSEREKLAKSISLAEEALANYRRWFISRYKIKLK